MGLTLSKQKNCSRIQQQYVVLLDVSMVLLTSILIPLDLFVVYLAYSPSTQSFKIPLRYLFCTVKGGGHSLLNVEWGFPMVRDGLMVVNFHQSIA